MTAIKASPKQRAWAWSLTNEQLAARLLDPHHSYTPQDTAALMAEAANRLHPRGTPSYGGTVRFPTAAQVELWQASQALTDLTAGPAMPNANDRAMITEAIDIAASHQQPRSSED